jgi:hypothetical protein
VLLVCAILHDTDNENVLFPVHLATQAMPQKTTAIGGYLQANTIETQYVEDGYRPSYEAWYRHHQHSPSVDLCAKYTITSLLFDYYATFALVDEDGWWLGRGHKWRMDKSNPYNVRDPFSGRVRDPSSW